MAAVATSLRHCEQRGSGPPSGVSMTFKRERLGPKIVAAARSGQRYRDVHVFLGGTGAVGGTAVLELLTVYEEMFSIAAPEPDDVPVIVATGTNRDEIRAFTRRLFRFQESRHGAECLPERVRQGYLTHSGVYLALERFAVTALPQLAGVSALPADERGTRVRSALAAMGAGPDTAPEEISRALAAAVPTDAFSGFLDGYLRQHLAGRGVGRFRSVVVGIPIPSLLAYHERALDAVLAEVPGLEVATLQERFLDLLRDDLVHVQADLAETLVVAHTTAVGGMYDEDASGRVFIRLGFAHSAQDNRLVAKQQYADRLAQRYAAAGVRMLVTAAAIGIDEVRVRDRIPMHPALQAKLFDAPVELYPGSQGRPVDGSEPPGDRSRQFLASHRPITVELDEPEPGPVVLDRGETLRPSYALRSGENGFFSVANADALYRVMRVASAAELGLVLATVALFGDDGQYPWFRDSVCYYPETDNSRQVFDFLAQPRLRQAQLTGLDPLALQDLGSAKHQGELHTLGLLILLHRLRTLDVSAIDPYVDTDRFDPAAFFVAHSSQLTFDDVAMWQPAELARELGTLVTAATAEELLPLLPTAGPELFPDQARAKRMVLDRVLRAVWTVPSLGSPIVFERNGMAHLRIGYYVAPLELLTSERTALWDALHALHKESGNPCSYGAYRDYHLCVGGFVDLRPHAILCSAPNDSVDLSSRVTTYHTEGELRLGLAALEPYSFFATAGLLAVLFRLRALHRLLSEAMIETGTLQSWRWHMPREVGRLIVVPGVVESLRMVAEGLEKTTGTERLDGLWGYERRPVPDRRSAIPGLRQPGAGRLG
jgi:hypothetical protein